MHKFLSFFVLVFVSFTSAWGMKNPEEAFNPDDAWDQLFYLASKRSDTLKESMKNLVSDTVPLSDRIQLAQTFYSTKTEEILLSKGFSAQKKKELQEKKYLTAIYNDLLYAELYWDFLKRTLEEYQKDSNHPNLEIQRAHLLPHLAGELVNFSSFTVEDLKQYPKNRYHNEEFSINWMMYQECQQLATVAGIEIPAIELAVKKSKNLSEQERKKIIPGNENDWVFEGNSYTPSMNSAFFLERLIAYRTYESTTSKTALVDLEHVPMLKKFQAYVLQPSGPSLVEELRRETPKALVEERPKRSRNKQKVDRKPPVAPKKKPASQKRRQRLIEITEESESEPEIEVVAAPTPPIRPSIQKKDLPKTVEIQEPFFHPEKPDLRKISFNITYRDSPTYTYQGHTYSFPFKHATPYYEERFLRKIKVLIHSKPLRPDHFPNLATGWIRFHFLEGQKNQVKTMDLENLFLSGTKIFAPTDLGFKKEHGLVNAVEDILDSKERQILREIPCNKKSIPLKMMLDRKLRKIFEIGWNTNSSDSEAILLLKLHTKLPQFLNLLALGAEPKTLTGVVLGISSYRDPCENCEQMIQRFQHHLPNIISTFKIPNLRIDPNFASLTVAYGHIRHDITRKQPIQHGPASLEPKLHQLVCTQSF